MDDMSLYVADVADVCHWHATNKIFNEKNYLPEQ